MTPFDKAVERIGDLIETGILHGLHGRDIAKHIIVEEAAAGYVLIPEKATEEMVGECYSGFPGDDMSFARKRINAAIAEGAVKPPEEETG